MMDIIVSLTLLFAGIVVLVLIHVCIVLRAFGGGDEDGDRVQSIYVGTKRMSREEVKRLLSFDYKEAERGASLADCAVCLREFQGW
ncbi:hypothetical protein L6164_011072 [Bauhinia variegata]|uniref:Uncharacterized protein n=1 Tax=Bauhinia variegata TaxID=167791 RepID=A0ACB9P4V6_BAUVA|nr:hypothetical protein L6164_011072 [Bauhinia variegata]